MPVSSRCLWSVFLSVVLAHCSLTSETSHLRDVPPPNDAAAEGSAFDAQDVLFDVAVDHAGDATGETDVSPDTESHCGSTADCSGGLVCCIARGVCVDPRCNACCFAVPDAGMGDGMSTDATPTDAVHHDAVPVDVPSSEAGGPDSTATDAGVPDGTGFESGTGETGARDAMSSDTAIDDAISDVARADVPPPPDGAVTCTGGGGCPTGQNCCVSSGVCYPVGCLACCTASVCTPTSCGTGQSCCPSSGACYPSMCLSCCAP